MPGVRAGRTTIGIGKGGQSWAQYWEQRKPYFVIDNTGNNQPLVNAQVKITLTGADVTIANILSNGSNLFFYTTPGETFIHSYIDYLTASLCEVYISVSCPANYKLYLGLKIQAHAFVNDYANVMIRRVAHASTNMLYTCADIHDSLAHGADMSLQNGAAIASTKYGNVFSFDGSNDYATIDILKTIPEYGGFGFNFVLPDNSWDNAALHTIFSKVWGTAKSYFILQITTDGFMKVFVGEGTNDLTWTDVAKPAIGKIHSFYVRWTKNSTIAYYDGNIVIAKNKKVIASPTNPDTCFFGSYNATLQRTKCYIYDVEYNDTSLPIIYQRSHSENISLYQRTQSEKLTLLSQIPSTVNVGTSWGEGSLIFEGGLIKLYHNQSYTDADHNMAHNMLRLTISHDLGITWDAPIDIMGYTTATEPTKGIYQPNVFKDSGTYYCIYRRHDDTTQLFIRESTDGITFTNPQTFLNNAHGTPFNSSIINDNGTYRGLVDVGATINGFGSYVQYYIEGTSLMTMAYGSMQTSIGLRSIYNYGAPSLVKIGNKYCCWTEQSLVNEKAILPNQCYYSESMNPADNTWSTNTKSILSLDSQYADDQNVDGFVTEYNGETYFLTGKGNNDTPFKFIMSLYKYSGTLDKFIKDVSVTHHNT